MQRVKYVKSYRHTDPPGFTVSADAYIEKLPSLQDLLPPNANLFASDPEHYNFYGTQCVKDLKFEGISQISDSECMMTYAPNVFKHESGLTLTYTGITLIEFQLDGHSNPLRGLGTVLIDEILPARPGCSHEISLIEGRIYIECSDLRAQWLDPARDK